MKSITKGLVVFALAFFALGYLGGCNTIEGAGKDISAAGDGIAGASRDVKDNIND